MRAHSHNFAFTLIELVLVMAIVAIVCMIAAPSLAGFTRGRVLPNSATQFAATARWCRAMAISDGLNYRLNIDAAGRYWWCSKDSGDGTTFVPINDQFMGQMYPLPAEVSIQPLDLVPNDNGLYVAFDPAGHTTPATFRLHYQDNWIDITCDTPLSSYHVLKPGEQP